MHTQISHLLGALDSGLVERAVATFAPGGDIQALEPMHQAQLLSMIAQLASEDPENQYVVGILLMEAQRLDPDGGPYLTGGLLSMTRSPDERYSMLVTTALQCLEADKYSLASLAMATALVIERPDKDPSFFMHLGDIYVRRGLKRESARYQYEQAVAHGWDEAQLHLAGLALERGEADEALALVARALEATKIDFDSYCDAFIQLGFSHAALALLLHLDAQPGVDCAARLGEVYGQMGRFEDAIGVYQEAIAAGDVLHYHNLGAIYERMEEPDRAIESFERGLEHGVPESAMALARHYLQREQPDLAAQKLVAYLELNENIERLQLELDGSLLVPFIEAVRPAIRRSPRRAALRLALIDALKAQQDADAVLSQAKLLLKNCGLAHAPTALSVYVDQDRTRAASNLCAKVIEDPELSGRVHAHAHATRAYVESKRAERDEEAIEAHIDRACSSHPQVGRGGSVFDLSNALTADGARSLSAFVLARSATRGGGAELLRAMLERIGGA